MKIFMLAMAFMPSFGLMGALRRKVTASGPATGNGTMDFSNVNDSGLVALLEDI